MRSYFRLLPLTNSIAALLLLVKVVQGVQMGQDVFSSLVVAPVAAQEEEDEPAEEGEDGEDIKEEMADGDGEGEAASDEDDDLLGGFLEIKRPKITADDLIGNQLGGLRPDDRRFSPLELKILQQLSERRKNLDKREAQLALRENLLTQTEKRVDEKLQEVRSLQSELTTIITQYEDVEETKVQSLVKIYESMKPKDAARIFDQMELPILITVIDKMAEKKAAPILAGMTPEKAKELTVELAQQRQLEDDKRRARRGN